jgi:hypothetical protein
VRCGDRRFWWGGGGSGRKGGREVGSIFLIFSSREYNAYESFMWHLINLESLYSLSCSNLKFSLIYLN